MAHGADQRWKGRPAAAALLRGGVIAVPIAASMLVAAAVSRLLPPYGSGLQALQWWLAVTVPATSVLWLVDRLARRLLPLAMLLRVSLLFPDRAPSRYAVARAASSTKELERRVARARSEGIDDEPTAAAETLLALVAALGAHDRRTRGHAERVRVYTDMLAEELHVSRDGRDRLRWAALMHDMGKLTVPARLLNKGGPPTDGEWQVLRAHPAEGARLCAPLLPWLEDWGMAIMEHHERFDGAGYPMGLAGDQISVAGRVLAVADAYEVMTAPRAYRRRPLSAVAARRELLSCAGTHFDPVIVRAFLNISLARLRLAMGPLAWLAQWPVLRHSPPLGPSAGWATASIGGAAALSIGAMAYPSRVESSGGELAGTVIAARIEAGSDSPDRRSDGPQPSPATDLAASSARHPVGEPAGGTPGALPRVPPNPAPQTAPTPSPSGVAAPQSALPEAGAPAEQLSEALTGALDDPAGSLADIITPASDALAGLAEVSPDPIAELGDPAEALPDPVSELAEPVEPLLDPLVDSLAAPDAAEEAAGILDPLQ